MISSVTFPDVVKNDPRAQKRLPQQRLRNAGNAVCMRHDAQSLIRCITFDSDSFGGIDRKRPLQSEAFARPQAGLSRHLRHICLKENPIFAQTLFAKGKTWQTDGTG